LAAACRGREEGQNTRIDEKLEKIRRAKEEEDLLKIGLT
jgi:hypothetical protein